MKSFNVLTRGALLALPALVTLLSGCALNTTGTVFSGELTGLDSDFGNNGGYTAISFRIDVKQMAVLRDPSTNDVLLATLSASQLLFTRLLPGGALDTGFGTGGTLTIDLDTSNSRVFSQIAFEAGNGSVVVYGDAGTGSDTVALLQRFTSQGEVDSSFGTNGEVSPGFVVQSMAVGSDGTIALIGTQGATSTVAGTSVTARLLPAGTFDPAFGSGKVEVVTLPSAYKSAAVSLSSVALLSDKSFAFVALTANGGSTGGPVLVHYLATGGLDTAFGSGGIAAMNGISTSASIDGLQIGVDNSIYVHATNSSSTSSTTSTQATSPFSAESFSSAGYFLTDLDLSAVDNCMARLGLTSDGHVFGGSSYSTGDGAGVCFSRFTGLGVPDTTFGTSGVVSEPFASTLSGDVLAIVPESDEGTLAVGYTVSDASTPVVSNGQTSIVAFVMRVLP